MTSSKKQLSLIIALIAIAACAALFYSPYAYAEEDGAEVSAQASVTVNASTTNPRLAPLRILKSEIEEKRDMVKDRIGATRADIKATIEARITERKDTRGEHASSSESRRDRMASSTEARGKMKGRISLDMVLRNMVNRLTTAIERFENIASRIDSRIEKLKAEGKDVSAAVTLQSSAKAKIAEAKVAVSAIVQPSISAEPTREELKAAFEGIRAKVKAAEEAVKAAHKALLEVVVALKRIDASAGANASTTASGN